MLKLRHIIKKDLLVLLRDYIGLSIVFLMPFVLVLVMTLLQEGVYNAVNSKGIKIGVVNFDQGEFGQSVIKELERNKFCEVEDFTQHPDELSQAINSGEVLTGLHIPPNSSKIIEEKVGVLVAKTMGEETDSITNSEIQVELTTSSLASKELSQSINSELKRFLSEIKNQLVFTEFKEQVAEYLPDGNEVEISSSDMQMITYNSSVLAGKTTQKIPSSAQQNVPAWTIFSMFFIVISVVGNLWNEKAEGIAVRLKIAPTSYAVLMLGKIIVFTSICMLQFILMMLVGKFLIPLFEMEGLQFTGNYWGIFLLALTTSLSAVAFGVLVGTLAKSHQQGAIVGSLFVLLFSALGGIWIPTFLMSDTMQFICSLSPLNWSLEGFQKVFILQENFVAILPNVLKLFAFFVLTIFATFVFNKTKK